MRFIALESRLLKAREPRFLEKFVRLCTIYKGEIHLTWRSAHDSADEN